MDSERVTRTTLPQVTVGMPLSLLKWVDQRAKSAGMSRSGWIVKLIESTRDDIDGAADADRRAEELLAVS